ncbi:MAG TPA: N-acetyltransferase [Pyrinomonadaceae bacterium]|nr:N-acetyltransferase [Pyrinomonadaceae bacterium]
MKRLTTTTTGNRPAQVGVRLVHKTIQQHQGGMRPCRTPACAAPHAAPNANAHGRGIPNPNQVRGPVANALPQAGGRPVHSPAPNYRVHMPVPLGHGSHQIRATVQGTPQVAGSVELSAARGGKVYISNLKVDQQHRRRGIAAKLIDAAISTARRQGFKAASLEARPSDNGISPQALVAMYRRQGFRSVGKSQRGSPLMERKL